MTSEYVTKSECQRCGTKVYKHKKCLGCGILLHLPQNKYKCRCSHQHGVEVYPDYCKDCGKQKINENT